MLPIVSKANNLVNKGAFWTKQHAPQLMIAGGVLGELAAMGFMIWATLKVQEPLGEAQAELEAIEDTKKKFDDTPRSSACCRISFACSCKDNFLAINQTPFCEFLEAAALLDELSGRLHHFGVRDPSDLGVSDRAGIFDRDSVLLRFEPRINIHAHVCL